MQNAQIFWVAAGIPTSTTPSDGNREKAGAIGAD
jgi:hypothetical protein